MRPLPWYAYAYALALLFLVWSRPCRAQPRHNDDVAPKPTTASTSVSLLGFERGDEVGAMLMLSLPFDRMARGNTRASIPIEYAAYQAAPTVETTQPFELLLTPRLARSVVNAAWRASGIGSDDARLDAIVSRAHWSAILPETRLRAIRYDNATLLSSLDDSGGTYLRDSGGTNIGLEARLTWRFDRLLYSDDEPSFERIRLEQRDARSRVAAKSLELLFHWQRAQLDLRTLPPSQIGTRDEADVVLRVMETEAALDVVTNGWFTTHRPKRGVSSAL